MRKSIRPRIEPSGTPAYVKTSNPELAQAVYYWEKKK